MDLAGRSSSTATNGLVVLEKGNTCAAPQAQKSSDDNRLLPYP